MSDVATPFGSNDVIVEDITIESASGISRNITFLYTILKIHENIFHPVMTGSIQIADGINLFSQLSLNGTEFLKISFKKPSDNTKYKKIFRIYSCTGRQPNPENLSQIYVLHFCSEELILSNQLLVSRAYKNRTGTDYIKSILATYLQISGKKYQESNFEPSIGTSEFILTNSTPFDAINTVAKYSYSLTGSPFLFFENINGFNFRSIERMCSEKPVTKLNYSTAKITTDPTNPSAENYNEMLSFEFDSSFNVKKLTETAALSGTLYTLDLVRQKYVANKHSIMQPGIGVSLLDKQPPIADAINRKGNNPFVEYDTNIKYSLTNLNQTNTDFASSRGYRVVNTNVEKVLMQREMHLSLLNNIRLRCKLPGNPNYTVGTVVEFDMPSFIKEEPTERLPDPSHAGKYLITSLKHTITRSEGFETALVLCKNSSAIKYDVSNSKSYREAITS